MNKITATLVFITIIFNLTAMAQKGKKYKEIQISKTSEVINVSADSLWKIVREFEKVGDWTSTLESSTGSGVPEFEGASCSERTCELHNIGGYGKIIEKLTMYDEANKELAYKITEGVPGFVLHAGNHWKVSEVNPNQSVITMNVTMRLKRFFGFFLGRKMKKTAVKSLDIVLAELKLYAETGEVSEEKKTAIKKMKKKQQKNAYVQ